MVTVMESPGAIVTDISSNENGAFTCMFTVSAVVPILRISSTESFNEFKATAPKFIVWLLIVIPTAAFAPVNGITNGELVALLL